MKLSHILMISAVCGLILIMTASILYAAGLVIFKNYTIFLLAGTLIWFAGTILSTLSKKNRIGK